MHTLCDVHVSARMHKRVLDPTASCIIGVLRHALSLQSSASMNVFRAALRAVIRERGGVKLTHESPLVAATRRRAFRCQAGTAPIVANRPENVCPSPYPDDCSRKAESNFKLYPRHRWCGADLAIDRCGILEAVHELGSGAYTHFFGLAGPSPVQTDA